MRDHLTVYFDTNFFVWLANASEQEADQVIADLNDLEVRHVLSGQVVLELLSNAKKPEMDIALVNRVAKFKIEPLRISANSFEAPVGPEELSWEILLLEGSERESMSVLFKSIFDLQTQAESWSKLARSEVHGEGGPKIQKSLDPFLEQLGFEKDKEYSTEETAEKYLDYSNNLFKFLEEVSGLPTGYFDRIELPNDLNEDGLIQISNELTDRIGVSNVNRIEEGNKIVDSTTSSDERPFKVVIDEASKREKIRLGNTFRDSYNMNLFVAHKNEIDLLQLDSAQKRQIDNQKKPLHRMMELGLANRCFCSNSLVNTVEEIAGKKSELGL